MDEAEEVCADQLGRGDVIKHAKAGDEWVTVTDVRPAGKSQRPPVLDSAGTPTREWNSVDIQLDNGQWLTINKDEQVTRRKR
jgi:hypothetical protein